MSAVVPRRSAVLLMGPTGAGKSALALELCQRVPLEIVSVDSAMVYRRMDVGTAKPDPHTRARVVHHLIDIREPCERYSAGDFVHDSVCAMRGIWERGKIPLLVGGTMLYFHALTHGIATLPEADAGVRSAIDVEAEERGWAAMHARLAQIDPEAAARIHANDPQRIQRALEVFQLTGQTISSLQRHRVSSFADVNTVELAIAPAERRDLHRAIEQRFKAMLAAGFVEEVRRIREIPEMTAEHPSMRAVGYRQIWRHLVGHVSLRAAEETAIAATRQLAKRQYTWMRGCARLRWYDSMHRETASEILAALSECGIL